MMNTQVSVIVPTYQGEKKIAILIEALKKQTFTDFELVVVIDGSTDNTLKILESIQTPFGKIAKTQTNRGRAASRNAGVPLAKGELLIFYDDDMEPSPTSIALHTEFHKKYMGILTGNQFEIFSRNNTDIQNYKAHLSSRWTEKYDNGLNQLTFSNLFFTAANSSFKRSDFEKLRGFNEVLSDAEDYEIAIRALKSDLNVYFDKSNRAAHNDKITCKNYIRRQKDYRLALANVYQIHPDISQNHNTASNILEKIIYKAFSFTWQTWLVDSFNIFLLLPKIIRYKIYDVMIYVQSRR